MMIIRHIFYMDGLLDIVGRKVALCPMCREEVEKTAREVEKVRCRDCGKVLATVPGGTGLIKWTEDVKYTRVDDVFLEVACVACFERRSLCEEKEE